MTPSREQSPSREALEKGYEPSDASPRGLLAFVAVFLATAVVIHVGLWFLDLHYLRKAQAADVAPASTPLVEHFAAPHLQPSVEHNRRPWEDMADLRREENDLFGSLGWKIDPDSRVPVIPDRIVAELSRRPASAPSTREGRP